MTNIYYVERTLEHLLSIFSLQSTKIDIYQMLPVENTPITRAVSAV